ncbi:hypothetical protein Tco_1190313, partial [Tanacetum coccineum]
MQADILSIKGMVTKMFQSFKGISSSTPSYSASILLVTQPKVHATIGESSEKQVIVVWQKPPSYTEAEQLSIVKTTKEPEVEDAEKEPECASQPIPIIIFRPL